MDVHCDNCDAILDVTDDLFGKEIDCPGCGSRFVAVPMPDAPPAPPPAPTAPPPAPAKPLSRRILRSVVRVLLGTVLGLGIPFFTIKLIVGAQPKELPIYRYTSTARDRLGFGALHSDVETLAALYALADKPRLTEQEILQAHAYRAELMIRHDDVALRVAIGPSSVTVR
jgi:DNA-directed RNA polymerase subunit RPC12/RpoP